MVTPARLMDQLLHLVSLVRHLWKRSCIVGACQLANRISSVLSGLEVTLAAGLKQPEIDAYVDLIVDMETDVGTSNPQRLSWLASFFPRLDSFQQCRLVVDLYRKDFARLKGVPSCLQMYRDLCHVLPLCDLHATSHIDGIIAQLLECYLKTSDPDLLQSLTDKICCPGASGKENRLLEAILSSASLWDLLSESHQLGRSTLVSFVHARIESLGSLTEQTVPVVAEEAKALLYEPIRHSWIMAPCEEAFRSALSHCFFQVFRLEKIPATDSSASDTRSRLADMYAKLSVEHLAYLVVDIRQVDQGLKDHPIGRSLVVDLCGQLVARTKDAMPGLSHELVADLITSFLWLGDVSLLRLLVKQICMAGSGGSWSPADKNALLERLLLLPAFASSSRLIRDTSTALTSAWIVGLCRILDQTGYDPASGDLRSKIAACVNIFIKSDGMSSQPGSVFSLLLNKLSVEHLCHLILDLRKLNADSVKPHHPVFADLCRLLVSRDTAALVKTCGWLTVEVWKCLAWLDDGPILMSFSQKMLEAGSDDNQCLVTKVVCSPEVRSIAYESLPGRQSLLLFLNHRIEQLKSAARPYLSWDHPFAVFPGHPEVEAFLRSPHKSMVYDHRFATFAQACKFADRLNDDSMSKSTGYSCKATPVRSGKSIKCKIAKTLSRNALLNKEVEELAEFRQNLTDQTDGSKPCQRPADAKYNHHNNVIIQVKTEPIVSDEEDFDDDDRQDDEMSITRPEKRAKTDGQGPEPVILIDLTDY